MSTNPSNFKNRDDCVVEKVSWEDVQKFLKKLNQQSGKLYHLPTETEWEYAARGGGKATLFGNGKNTIDPKAINVRVIRGRSLYDYLRNCRVAYRNYFSPSFCYSKLRFRLARSN